MTSFCIVDAQSVKNTGTAWSEEYDAGKKVSGIKRDIAVDSQGLPYAIEVTTAEVDDREGALLMFALNTDALSNVRNVLERFRFDLPDDPGCFASDTALCGDAESSLPWPCHVASPRLVSQVNHLGLA